MSHILSFGNDLSILKFSFPTFLWFFMIMSCARPQYMIDYNIVHLVMTLELNNIKVYEETFDKHDGHPKLLGMVHVEGILFQDLNNFKKVLFKANNILFIKTTLQSDSEILIDCYIENLLRLVVQQFNTTLLMLGRISSCSSLVSPKYENQIRLSPYLSYTVFKISIEEEFYRLMLRDLVYSDQHMWNEALVIYDQEEVFSSFSKVMETTDKIFHFRFWTLVRTTNAEILKNFRHVRTYIIVMKEKNVHSFFLLASGLQLFNTMTSTVIVIDSNNVLETIRDFAFMTANITVIRPSIDNGRHFRTGFSDSLNSVKTGEVSQRIYDVFTRHLKSILKNQNETLNILKKNHNFLSPEVWINNFKISISADVELILDSNKNYCFDFKFDVIYLGENYLELISYWSRQNGFIAVFNRSEIIRDRMLNQIHNKTFRITTLEDPPFVMYREKDEHGMPLKGNDRYFGMAIDILKALSEMKKFNYVIHTVRDETFGSLNETTGKWNGMIGELINNEADMAVASLTITYDRERVIDFTTPWMSLGLSIVIKKSKSTTKLLQFMAPLSTNVWLMMLGSYVAVSITLFLVGRMTPYEWYVKHPCYDRVENQFSVLNSFWFTVGSLMQQGCDISPKATSTRMIGTIWWFFILIMISSYTANLAAFLTIERLQNDITSVEELASQTKVKYGTIYGGSTYSFFKNSNISTYKKMWTFMRSDQSLFVENTAKGIQKVLDGSYAFILESTLNEYYCQRKCNLMPLGGLLDSRGYAIGLPSGNNILRDLLSESILRLQKEQILEAFRRQWLLKYNLTKSCYEHSNHAPTIRNQLGLEKMGGAFFGLIIGLTISCMVSCLEMTIWASRKAMKNKKGTVRDVIRSQIKTAFGQYHHIRSNSSSPRSLCRRDSMLCNTFKAGSATITIPSLHKSFMSLSHEQLYHPLPFEQALLMKCNLIKKNMHSQAFNNSKALNGLILQDSHKVTSL